MNNIITLTVKKQEARVSSESMAGNLKIAHKNVLALINSNKHEFEELNPLAFETRKGEPLRQGGFAKSTRYALLTEDQSYLLLTFTKNTARTKPLKVELVKAFSRFRNQKQEAKDYLPFYHALHDAVKTLAEYAHANGSTAKPAFFHITYNKLIDKACGIETGQRANLDVNTRVNATNAAAFIVVTIRNGINVGVDYHDIYKQAKEKVAAVTYTGQHLSHAHIVQLSSVAGSSL